VMGYESNFIMLGGNMEYFKCLVVGEKWTNFTRASIWGGNECLVVGNWTEH
jgi:hypothetical protein